MLKSIINHDAAGKNTLGFMLIMLLALSTSLFAQNNALDFDGTDDYVSVAHNASLNVESSFTIECWFYTDNNTDEKILLEKGTWDGSWLFFLKPDAGNLKIALASSSWTNINLLGTTTLSSGKWYHFAATWDGTTRKVYLNGNEENSDTPTGDPTSNSEALTIGDRTGGGSSFDGKIDEVRIWDDVRTETEIRQNMYRELPDPSGETNLVAYYKLNETSGTAADNSEGNSDLDGTLNNMTGNEWQTSPAMFGPKNALDFDGTDDYVDLGSGLLSTSNASQAFTIECWAKTTYTGASTKALISQSTSGTNRFKLAIQSGNFIYWKGGANKAIAPTDFNDGGWHHLTATRSSSGDIKLYLDGILEATGTDNNAFQSANTIIGKAARIWNGQIDEVRIWDDIRTVSEIRENMCKTLIGNESGLVAYYNFDNTSGTTLQDFTGNGNNGTLTNMTNDDWVASSAFNTWLNTNSSTWSTATNWSRGSAPVSTDNVGIYSYSGGTNASLSGSPTVENLLLGGSSAMTLSSAVTVNSNLILESNLDLNGQTITLGSGATLIEDGGLLAGSTGSITTTRSLSNINENVGGLGAEITEDGDLGSSTITRGHTAQGSQGIERYYQITTTNSPSSATLVFHYDDSELNGQTEGDLELFKSSDGSTWTEQSASTINTTDNKITLTGINAFSYWTAAPTGSDQSLPVELAAFTAENQSGGVLLKWVTESEIENLGFILSRRLKAQSLKWTEIASYLTNDALAGHGSTTQRHAYRYTDTTVEPGATYEYRLGDVDYRGNVIWHDAVEITLPVADAAIPATFGLQKAYPNPFNPAVTLQYDLTRDGETVLQVYNVRGQLVETPLSMFQTAGSYAFTWQPQNLNTGVYVVRLQSGKQHTLQKVVFIK